jgi:phage terminase large subunit-like protein
MRWAIQNSKTVVSNSGNITYGKIEPKSRKTDPFKAFVAAEIISDCLDDYVSGGNLDMPDVIDF